MRTCKSIASALGSHIGAPSSPRVLACGRRPADAPAAALRCAPAASAASCCCAVSLGQPGALCTNEAHSLYTAPTPAGAVGPPKSSKSFSTTLRMRQGAGATKWCVGGQRPSSPVVGGRLVGRCLRVLQVSCQQSGFRQQWTKRALPSCLQVQLLDASTDGGWATVQKLVRKIICKKACAAAPNLGNQVRARVTAAASTLQPAFLPRQTIGAAHNLPPALSCRPPYLPSPPFLLLTGAARAVCVHLPADPEAVPRPEHHPHASVHRR
jgi:hypothetical protein